jgi:hypothetical protein
MSASLEFNLKERRQLAGTICFTASPLCHKVGGVPENPGEAA